ncbi:MULTISPECIES: hypothetical protein [unclassified Streptomyces]|uniref:hypothetical protein n=1 Tax=unclassified Streptomyces TaxID=2593676 RepID=UPI00331B0E37
MSAEENAGRRRFPAARLPRGRGARTAVVAGLIGALLGAGGAAWASAEGRPGCARRAAPRTNPG